MADYSYLGVGKIFIKEFGSAAGLMEVGNASALNLTVNEDVKELKDFTQVGGGTFNEVRRIASVEASMTLFELSAANVARAIFGTASAIAAGAVTDESHTAYVGAFIPTNFPFTGSLTVKEGAATLTAGTDYEQVPGGIKVLGGALADGDTVLISYTKAAGNAVEALLSSAKEYEIFFSGLNEARSGKAVTVHLHRVKLGAASSIPLIGEDFASLEVSGKVLKDTSKNGTTVSQYYNVQIVT